MSKKIFLVNILFSIQGLAQGIVPTSEIPAKRDFPLSEKFRACDDFHRYVCDEAESAFKLRDDRSRHTFSFNDSSERILEAKKKFFAHIDQEKNISKRSLQVKDYYQACMNPSAGQRQEKFYLKKMITELSKLKTAEQFMNYQVQNVPKGEKSFFWFATNSNPDQPEVNDVLLMTNLMNLPEHSYYENTELMAAYRSLIIDFFQIVSPKLKIDELRKKADRLILFEKDFVKIYPLPVVQRQRWSSRRQESQAEFLKKYPNLALATLFKNIPTSSLVANYIPEGLEFLNQKIRSEDLEVIKDFYLYSSGAPILDDSNPEYFNKQFAFNNKFLGGSLTRSVRHERCTRETMGHFAKEVDQILIDRLFPNFPEEKFMAVAVKVRESIMNGLKNNTWLEPQTKAKAILKMEKAKLYLVKPKNEKEWDFIKVIKFSNKNKIENNILSLKNVYAKRLFDLKNGVNLEGWGMGPLTVNAYYDASANKFVMPMGLLQYPFFNPAGDLIENLGAVGSVIGHELGHGIDDEGSKYDEAGKLNQWMTMNDLAQFSSRGRKMIDQFNKAGHNGGLTLGENIGDFVGLTFAYRAAFPDGQGSVEDKRKLFIAYARVWCNVSRPKAIEQLLKTDPHALGWARINEQVKNQKAFAVAFQCKAGDQMTIPDSERIQIW